MVYFAKILLGLCLALPLITATNGDSNLLDVEIPSFLSYPSPLRKPESLRNRPYFDFLSTLYRRDADKSSLFRPYLRDRRAAVQPENVAELTSIPVAQVAAGVEQRQKRAILFRPLFVYRQQQIRKQEVSAQRKVRV